MWTRALTCLRAALHITCILTMFALALGVIWRVPRGLDTPPRDDPGDGTWLILKTKTHALEYVSYSKKVCWWSIQPYDGECYRFDPETDAIAFLEGRLQLQRADQTSVGLIPVELDAPEGTAIFPAAPALQRAVPRSARFPAARNIYWSDLSGRLLPYRMHRRHGELRALQHPSGAWVEFVKYSDDHDHDDCCSRVRWWEDDERTADALLCHAHLGHFKGLWPTVDGVRVHAWRGRQLLGEESGTVDLAAGTLRRIPRPTRSRSNFARRPVQAALWSGLLMLLVAWRWPRRWWRWPLELWSISVCVFVSVPLSGLLLGLSWAW